MMIESMTQLSQQGRKNERYIVSSQKDTSALTLQPCLRNQAERVKFTRPRKQYRTGCLFLLLAFLCYLNQSASLLHQRRTEILKRDFGMLTVVFTMTLAVDCTRSCRGTLRLLFVGLRFDLALRIPSCRTSTRTTPIPVDIPGYEQWSKPCLPFKTLRFCGLDPILCRKEWRCKIRWSLAYIHTGKQGRRN